MSEEQTDPAHVRELDGVRVVEPVAAVSFEVRQRARCLADAVSVIDMVCFTDAVSLAELARLAETQTGWRGIARLRRALPLADENSWSPQESLMRWRWLAAGLEKPRCNPPLFDLDGRHLLTPDLLHPVLGLVAEYDGSDHASARARLADVRRAEMCRDLDIECATTLVGDDDGCESFRARLLRARRRATGTTGTARQWTAEPPTWWTPTHTVERRRALTPDQRARLLRYRH